MAMRNSMSLSSTLRLALWSKISLFGSLFAAHIVMPGEQRARLRRSRG